MASRYLPGSTEAEVGGDWYDVIAAPDEQLFLVIGDVVGKGVQAAAGMGQLRNALRAYILEGFDCGEALTRLNRLVDNLGRRQFATVVCVRFDPRTQRAVVLRRPGTRRRWSPRRARRACSSTPPRSGPPIGALSEVTYPTREARLGPGQPAAALHRRAGRGPARRASTAAWPSCAPTLAKPADHVEDLLDTLLAKARPADPPRRHRAARPAGHRAARVRAAAARRSDPAQRAAPAAGGLPDRATGCRRTTSST